MKKLLIVFLYMLFIFSLWPLETDSNIITAIEVIGIKRTKPYIASYPLERFLGRDGTTLDHFEVEAAVRDTGILEPASVELIESENGMILRVTMTEKWSLFPVPIFSAVPGDITYGLFVADANIFGLRDQAAIGGIFGTYGWTTMALYNHSPNVRGRPAWNAFFSYNRSNRNDTDKYAVLYRNYSYDQIGFSYGMQFPMRGFALNTSISFNNYSLNETTNALNPPSNGATLLGFSPGISMYSSSWDGYLLSQRSLSVSYGYYHGFTGSSYHQFGFQGVFEQPFIPGFRFISRSGAVWKSASDFSSNLNPLFEDGQSRAQVNILPGSYAARSYAGLSIGLEKHLFSIKWGTLSLLGAWQFVISEGSISGFDFNNGPFAELRFYLSQLALPAMGVGITYNVNSGLFQLGFNMGTSL